MFYKTKLEDHIRVPPDMFGLDREEAIIKCIKKKYSGYISPELGIVIDTCQVDEIREGVIIQGDGASYYSTTFELLTFKPEMHEIILGKIKDIAEFGAFITIGPIEGMVHISQTMDDFVSFSKDKTLTGKGTKRVIKVNDLCRAKLIAVSFKDPSAPKLGLTMRHPTLGKLEWLEEEEPKEKKPKTKKK